MNRTASPPRSLLRTSPFLGPRGLLLVGLLAWAGGCAVEDPVAFIIDPDAGSGPLSTDGGGASDEWAPPSEEQADCAPGAPDAGAPCADAGTEGE